MKKIVAFLMALIAIMSLAVTACSPSQDGQQNPQETAQVSEKTDILKMHSIYESLIGALINTGSEYDPSNPKYVWEALYCVLSNYGYGVTDDFAKKLDTEGIYSPDTNAESDKTASVSLDDMKRLMAACFGPDFPLPKIPEGFEKITVENDIYTIELSPKTPVTATLYSYDMPLEDVYEVVVELLDDANAESMGGFYLVMETNPDEESPYPLYVTKLYKHELSDNRTKS